MATGVTSVVKVLYSNRKHTVNASQLAIAGKRVAWIKDQQFGNTEEGENALRPRRSAGTAPVS